jgi:hypothetical protein
LNNFDMLSFIDKSPTEKINLRFVNMYWDWANNQLILLQEQN